MQFRPSIFEGIVLNYAMPLMISAHGLCHCAGCLWQQWQLFRQPAFIEDPISICHSNIGRVQERMLPENVILFGLIDGP